MITLNLNEETKTVVLGGKWHVLSSRDYYSKSEGKITFNRVIPFKIEFLLDASTKKKQSECFLQTADLGEFKEHNLKNLSLLKSGLQKCVRRSETELALKIAKSFIRLSPKCFLRRLLVIAGEDVFINANCDVVMWLHRMTLLDDEFLLTKDDVHWLLGYVKYLCERRDYTDFQFQNRIERKQNETTTELLLRMYLDSMILMDGDRRFLTWYYNTGACNRKADTVTRYTDTVSFIDTANLPLYAIDFHTHPKMLKMVKVKWQSLSESEIKTLIWECRSSNNVRKPQLGEDKMELYEKIANEVEIASKRILNNI